MLANKHADSLPWPPPPPSTPCSRPQLCLPLPLPQPQPLPLPLLPLSAAWASCRQYAARLQARGLGVRQDEGYPHWPARVRPRGIWARRRRVGGGGWGSRGHGLKDLDTGGLGALGLRNPRARSLGTWAWGIRLPRSVGVPSACRTLAQWLWANLSSEV